MLRLASPDVEFGLSDFPGGLFEAGCLEKMAGNLFRRRGNFRIKDAQNQDLRFNTEDPFVFKTTLHVLDDSDNILSSLKQTKLCCEAKHVATSIFREPLH